MLPRLFRFVRRRLAPRELGRLLVPVIRVSDPVFLHEGDIADPHQRSEIQFLRVFCVDLLLRDAQRSSLRRSERIGVLRGFYAELKRKSLGKKRTNKHWRRLIGRVRQYRASTRSLVRRGSRQDLVWAIGRTFSEFCQGTWISTNYIRTGMAVFSDVSVEVEEILESRRVREPDDEPT